MIAAPTVHVPGLKEKALEALGLAEEPGRERDRVWREFKDLAKRAGLPPTCCSSDCLNYATKRVFWPGTLAGEDYPLYCDACAGRARRIAEVLGARCHDEPLPAPPTNGPRLRAISMEGL